MIDKKQKLVKFLIEGNFISEEQYKSLVEIAIKEKKDLEEILVEKELIKDSELGEIIAEINDWNYIKLRNEAINEQIVKLIPQAVARKQKILAFDSTDDGKIKVAFNNPDNAPLIHLIEQITNKRIILFYATSKDIHDSLRFYEKEIGSKFEKLIKNHDEEKIGSEADESSVVKMVDLLLKHGYENRASDIHIEPVEQASNIRFRIDGVMHDSTTIPKYIHDLIVARIKVMARLHTDEHQIPQDGKLQYIFEGERVDVRISIVPTTKGENVVMRLLVAKSRHFSMDGLGFDPVTFEIVQKNIKKPWGMILTTGPTGSGKTTTLYAILKILNKREINIATIEDPVEYNMEGITQIQVNPKAKLTFSSGLRSIVRQDPDIIMVGEIRDKVTASIATNSAMTGHLVLSTLHTNDAATTLPRLLEMGVDPFLVASTVNVAIAQRLLRKICLKCIQSYEVKKEELQAKVPADLLKKLIGDKEEISLFKGAGCKVCGQTGYDGRVGVFEILEMTNSIRELVISGSSAEAIQQQAVENGMKTMLEDGIEKVLTGVTGIDEIIRVVKS